MSDIVVVNVGDRVSTVQTVTAAVEVMFPGIQGPKGDTGGAYTSLSGMLKGDGAEIVLAVEGTDYAPGTSALASGIVKTAAGVLSTAALGVDYAPGTSALGSGIVKTAAGALSLAFAGVDYAPGTSALGAGLLKTSTGVLSLASSGTDYAPGTAALGTGVLKTTGGVLSIATSGDLNGATIPANVAYVDVTQVWSKPQRPFYLNTDTVSTTTSYTYDGTSKGQVNLITLTNATTVTFAAPTNIVEGTMYKFILAAGDTSARTFAWNVAYKFPAATAPLTSGAVVTGAYDIITFIGGASNTLIYDGSMANVR